jgi:NAD(P)-dependent dehydrogenase (short-subunit alcohol dehydrogenase family)
MNASASQQGAADTAMPFAGQHALVTGGGRGIGAAIAEALARGGARVTVVGRTLATLEAQRDRLTAAGAKAHAAAADVTDEDAVAAAFASATEAFGAPSILVNNAGRGESVPFKRMDRAFLQKMIDINLTSAFLCTQRALPAMTEAGFGRIVNVASTAGLIGYRYVSAYVASKHAVIGLTRALALETATTGVTVNAVCPSYVETDMTADTIANIVEKTGTTADKARAQLVAGNPQGRMIQPDEVANAACWLALPASGSITGQALAVAGGEVM